MPEERIREGYPRKPEVSVLSWMGTMLLFLVPLVLAGVLGYYFKINLLVLIGAVTLADIVLMVVLMLTTKRPSKRNALIAALILCVVFTVGSVLMCAFFGGEIVAFVEKLNAPAAASLMDVQPQAAETPGPTPDATPDTGMPAG